MSMEALDLLLPLNWSVQLIIWYLRIPYKSPPYFSDYNFKKRHLIHRQHQGRGRRKKEGPGGADETRGSMKIQLEPSVWYITLFSQIAALECTYAWEIFITWALADKYKKSGGAGVQGSLQMGMYHSMQESGFSPVGGRWKWSFKVKFTLWCMGKPWDQSPCSQRKWASGGLAPPGHSWILRCNRAENDFLGPSESINHPNVLAVEGRQTNVAGS